MNVKRQLEGRWAESEILFAISYIAERLDCSPEEIPSTLFDDEVAHIFQVKPHTIKVWRSTKARQIDHIKPGRSPLNLTTSVVKALLTTAGGTNE